MTDDLAYTQFLNFEVGIRCNLGKEHTKCPNLHPDRFALTDTRQQMSDDTIVACSVSAYREFGFTGLIGWHYYCEPMLYAVRIHRLILGIREAVPESRFVMWTNGTVAAPLEPELRDLHEQWRTTPYDQGVQLDDRLERRPSQGDKPCLRIFTEFVFDAYGQHHPCCYDWRGEASLGNVHDYPGGFANMVVIWRSMQWVVGCAPMARVSPQACLSCGWRTSTITNFDPKSAARAEKWRASC